VLYKFRALTFRIPLAEFVAEGKNPLLCPRLFFIATRAADAGVETEFRDGFEQGHRLKHVAALAGVFQHDPSAPDGVLQRAHDQPLAKLLGAMVAERNDLGKVVPGVDVQQRKWEAARPKRFFRQPQQDNGVLAAGKQQRRIFALRSHFPQDVDGFAFQRVEMGKAVAQVFRLRRSPANSFMQNVQVTFSFPWCRPHSLPNGSSHHQRPARTSSSAVTARVQGAQPILG